MTSLSMDEWFKILLAILGPCAALAIAMIKSHSVSKERFIRLEARFEMFVALLGTKAAKALHSPDDHHGLDRLLEDYIAHNHELSYDGWKELKERCDAIIWNTDTTKNEEFLAGMLSAVCEHKLMCVIPRRRRKI